ncbi:ATP-binding protein [Acanthopleuribacter pedis]|uniref:ATP-binding protein n=1 Tax=Acanthopleuribacter pedis TaxID=442870 RepID=A0A8J7QGG8_9BACT|nr:ATP-binding protein [Acanthopleuribacter pedis]MBO1319640.1 ATP-binding protein [Acanthopleuribacter pedis]
MKKASLGSPEAVEKFQEFCRQQAQAAREKQPEQAPRVCPLCRGKGYSWKEIEGYRHVVRCACQKERLAREALREAGIPEKFWNATLEDANVNGREPFRPWGGNQRDAVAIKSQTTALQTCRELRDQYLAVFQQNKPIQDVYGLMLFGHSGRGKTRLVSSLLVDLVFSGLYSVRFIEYNELFKMIRFSFNSKEISYQSIFSPLLKAKVLVIDDLGTELGGDLTWALDNIGYIINERYTRNLPTLFTSNHWNSINDGPRGGKHSQSAADKDLFHGNSWEMKKKIERNNADSESARSQKSLDERVNYRLRSRIREMCIEIKVEGFDFRNKLAKNREMLRKRRDFENN